MRKADIIGVYGASGFGRDVMPLLRSKIRSAQLSIQPEVVFVDDELGGGEVNGHKILSYCDFLNCKGDKDVIIAISNSRIREALSSKCEGDGVHPTDVSASNVVILDEVRTGQGIILCPFSFVASNVSIGKYFHLNAYAYVEHDCIVGDYVTFAPGAKCNGNVHIGDHAYIGAGAIIKQGVPDKPRRIGKGAIIGMGAVVTKDVPDGAVVVGNPAKILLKK